MPLLFSRCRRGVDKSPSQPARKSKGKLKTQGTEDAPTLDAALYSGNYAACFELLDRREGLKYRDYLNDTVLHTAGMRRSIFCGELIRLGVDPAHTNEYHETALHVVLTGNYVVGIDQKQVCRIASLELQDAHLRRLRDEIVARRGIVENTALLGLLLGGCNPNAKLVDRKTPLIVAVRFQAPLSVLFLLIQYGADPRLRDLGRKNALDWARFIGNDFIADAIQWAMTCITLLAANQRPLVLSANATKHVYNRLHSLPCALVRELCAMLRFKTSISVVGAPDSNSIRLQSLAAPVSIV